MINTLTGFRIVAEGHLRVAPLAALPRVMAAHGAAIADVLHAADLPPGLLDDADQTAPVGDLARLLAVAARTIRCDHVGLLVGGDITLDTVGPVGGVVRGAPDVGSALRGLIMALHLHDRATVPALQRSEGRATLSTIPLGAIEDGVAHVADLTMVACFNIMRGLCGGGWRAVEVSLARRAPGDIRPYARLFGVAPRFDAERNALVFPASWLKRPVCPAGSPPAGPAIDEVTSLYPLDPPARVRRACVRALFEGNATVTRIARLNGWSRRTLNRHLAPFGTTAQAELLQVKLGVAKQLLGGTDLALTEIGHLLGYADGSAFARAFRKVEGQAPSRWRVRAMIPQCRTNFPSSRTSG